MKIEEQVLSIEQMKHLQELGVDTSDASMAYYNISRDNQPDKWVLGIANKEVASIMISNGITEMKPTYTIGDLIEKLPKCCVSKLPLTYFYDLLCLVAENHKELL